jgi:hypothetical protein
MSNFYTNEYSNFNSYGVTLNYGYGASIDFEAQSGDFSSAPSWTYGSISTIQAYVAPVARVDTCTLTGSEGIADIVVDGYTEGAFNVNGVSCVWQGSLSATAAWFVDVYAAGYDAGGVTITQGTGGDSHKIIFTSKVAGVNFTGTSSIGHETTTFLGNLKIEGNEIWEDSIDSDTTSVLKINYRGYKKSDTRNRITMIGSGHGSSVVNISGEDGAGGLYKGLQVRQGSIIFPTHSTSTRDALTKTPGMVIWLSDGATKKLQVCDGSNWINLH